MHDGPPYANGDLHMGQCFRFALLVPPHLTRCRPCFEQDSQGLHQSSPCSVGSQSAVRLSNPSVIVVIMDTIYHSYMPGWDCHGLPIENKVLKSLGVRRFSLRVYRTSNTHPSDFSRKKPTISSQPQYVPWPTLTPASRCSLKRSSSLSLVSWLIGGRIPHIGH